MLLLLAEYLQQFHKGFAVFQYLTLRGILGVLTALALSLWLGPWMIRTLQIRQIGQAVRNDGPQSHLSKKGTPTMGGALILTSADRAKDFPQKPVYILGTGESVETPMVRDRKSVV